MPLTAISSLRRRVPALATITPGPLRFGNRARLPLGITIRFEWSASIAFVVYMIRRTPSGKAKNGITRSQLRRQLWAIAGYLPPPWTLCEGVERGLACLGIGRAIDV